VAFLSKHINELGPKAQATVKAADIGTRPVHIIGPATRTIDAFVMMSEYSFSALGFLAPHNVGSGNVSVKDVQGVLSDFENILLPVLEFVAHVRQESVRDMVPLVQVSEDDSVAKAVQRLAAVGVHRIYVSPHGESHGQAPVAVIALTDLLLYFSS